MSEIKYCLAAVMGTIALVLVGCENNSTEQSNSNDTASSTHLTTNGLAQTNPVVAITNAPGLSNNTDTNLPVATNQPTGH